MSDTVEDLFVPGASPAPPPRPAPAATFAGVRFLDSASFQAATETARAVAFGKAHQGPLGCLLAAWCFAVLAGLLAWHLNRDTLPGPTSTARQHGVSFRGPLAESLARGFQEHEKAIDEGKTLEEADKALKAVFKAQLNDAFDTRVSPDYLKITKDGSEPTDPAVREKLKAFDREFAAGLRDGRKL